MLTEVPRQRRSAEEGPGYSPQWRNLQATAYYTAMCNEVELITGGAPTREAIQDHLTQVEFPAWEDDDLVKTYFYHMSGGVSRSPIWSKAFNYVTECVNTNSQNSFATTLKVYLACGMTDEEITDHFPIPPLYISVFHNLFFDVRRYLDNPEVLEGCCLAGAPESDMTEVERLERRAMFAAIRFGPEVVMDLISPNLKYSEENLERIVKNRIMVQAAGASRRTMDNFTNQPTDNNDISFHQEDQRISVNRELARAKHEEMSKGEEKLAGFFEEVSTIYDQYGGALGDYDPIASVDDVDQIASDPGKGITLKRVG